MLTFHLCLLINCLSRDDIESILESAGVAWHDSDSTAELRETLRVAVEIGEVEDTLLEAAL